MIKKILLFTTIFSFSLFNIASSVYAQDATVTPTPTEQNNQADEINKLNDKIHEIEGKIGDLKTQENSLSSQISVMDNQIQLTQYRINVVQDQINEATLDIDTATKRIKNLENSLQDVSEVLLNRIKATYQAGETDTMQILLASTNLQDFLSRESYLKLVQEHDKELLYNTQQAKIDYANQKSLLESKKKKIVALQSQLEEYTKELDNQKNSQKKLLTETQGDEENYQRLLAAAKAQLEGFSRFTANQGGSSLLGGQTTCDDWGCYYNQRDTQWGAASLNGTQYTIASDGCLVTSMAMVYTHYGHRSVTPLSINSRSDNFASYYPAYLKTNIIADGVASSRASASIDSELSSGRPVIVGISYDGGPSPDHFLVLISGSNGSYMMNDPYTPNGHNIPFTSKYSVGNIREIDKVVM
jgi:peptidoglycan hydrolase CwlO-like protein